MNDKSSNTIDKVGLSSNLSTSSNMSPPKNSNPKNSNDWTLVTNKKQKNLASMQPYNTEKITIKRNGQTFTY